MADEEMTNAPAETSSKPFKFVPPRPPVLQPHVAALLKNPPTAPFVPPIGNPFAPKPVSPIPPKPPVIDSSPNVPKNDEKSIETPKNVNKSEMKPFEKPTSLKTDTLAPATTTDIPITPIVEEKQITSPAVVEISKQVEKVKAPTKDNAKQGVFNDRVDMSGGLMSWLTKTVAESKLLNDVAEKAKAGMETVMTTLDPGMKPFLAEHGVIELSIFHNDADVVSAANEGFSKVGALVIARGIPSNYEEFKPLVFGAEKASEICKKKLELVKNAKKSTEDSALIVLQPFLIQIANKYFSTTKLFLRNSKFECEAMGQFLEVSDTIVDYLKRNKPEYYAEDEFALTVSDAAMKIYNTSYESWNSTKIPPYSSSDLLINAFASIAQQLVAHLQKSINNLCMDH
ncbi:unnamed protein product [Caenorhabditis bovis]|uniref:Uncharacterized protein n=1 Tax=Caenorhabditis bovis TaxID=2654633 RepID=A0A8S1EVX0_9PELO|nr:unnamed protein product [Caenorhabditis bovis]